MHHGSPGGFRTRADSFLSSKIEDMSRSAAARLLEEGLARVCGAVIGKNYRVSPGEILELTLPDVKETALGAEDIPLDVIYEDKYLIVINKPRAWWCIPLLVIRTARWSTRFCTTAESAFPVLTEKDGPGLCTA
jgi:23S rRNA-/tRNA-specific pseudouridylate synthase